MMLNQGVQRGVQRGKLASPATRRYVLQAWLDGALQTEIAAQVGIKQPHLSVYLRSIFAPYLPQTDPAMPLRGRQRQAAQLALASLQEPTPAAAA